MFLMSTSILLCGKSIVFSKSSCLCGSTSKVIGRKNCLLLTSRVCGRRNWRNRGLLVANAKKDYGRHLRRKKKSWWRKFFDEEGNWFGFTEDDMVENEETGNSSREGGEKEELSSREKFEEWKKRAEAIIELREAQEDVRNEESRNWEDWIILHEQTNGRVGYDWSGGVEDFVDEDGRGDPSEMIPERGLVETVRDLVLGKEDDDLLYEDRVFRYVKTVPLAAEMLDVRRTQKLEMIEELKVERARFRFEVEIGKSPPLSEEELWLELRHKALELRDERRLENRRAFANIWSDMVFGISMFIILYFNQSKVALLKFTGYKILNNMADTGKAFLIILITDISLGYHSESGWQTLCEIVLEHYGLEVDQSAVTIFVCLVPVVIDAFVKLWLYKFLPRLSPKVSNILREMRRH